MKFPAFVSATLLPDMDPLLACVWMVSVSIMVLSHKSECTKKEALCAQHQW